ncbi:MAG: hypothetical protein GY806_08080, partial [Gammaproteobacteria bacterium]|nr:hypothetical protein [Gammaproteobacteria bacterium]
MSIKINMSIKIKLYIGLGTVMGIFLLVSLNTYYRINQTVEIQDRLLHLRHPTVIAGIQLQNGVNQSLAGLRGYMILGSNPDKASLFKAERASSWEQIDIALARFRDLSTDWT